jgi:hypothetical protein
MILLTANEMRSFVNIVEDRGLEGVLGALLELKSFGEIVSTLTDIRFPHNCDECSYVEEGIIELLESVEEN